MLGEVGNSYDEVKDLEKGYRGEHKGESQFFGDTKIHYMSIHELDAHEVFVVNGRLYGADGKPIHTTGATAIFVMDPSGAIFVRNKPEFQVYHHSSFLRGDDVASAGHIVVHDGVIKAINASTGHYRIDPSLNLQFLTELKARGYDTSSINNSFGKQSIDMTQLR